MDLEGQRKRQNMKNYYLKIILRRMQMPYVLYNHITMPLQCSDKTFFRVQLHEKLCVYVTPACKIVECPKYDLRRLQNCLYTYTWSEPIMEHFS